VCGGYDGAKAWISVNDGTRDEADFTYPNGIFDGTGVLRIGSGYNAEYLDGSLDEMALYRRSLTPAEVDWLYNSGNGRSYSDLSLPTPGETTFSYDTAHKHAVSSLSTNESYAYDANGNMICREENDITYKQEYDLENRLISVAEVENCSDTAQASTRFVYDGDGNLVMKVNPDDSATIYIGDIYEVDKSSAGEELGTRTYYPAGGAMRVDGTLYYILKDHLGSASVVTKANGTPVTGAEARYYPFGEARFDTSAMLTDKLYTGQRDTGLGIYYYRARFYSPYINHFISADTIIPNISNPQSLNRYSYVLDNPLKYSDPTGHKECEGTAGQGTCFTGKEILKQNIQTKYKKVKLKGNWDEEGLMEVLTGLNAIKYKGFHGNMDAFNKAFGEVTIKAVSSIHYSGRQVGGGLWQNGTIALEPGADGTTLIHEMGHILDGSLKRQNNHLSLYSETYANVFDFDGGATGYAEDSKSSVEDFADSFLAVIQYGPDTQKIDTDRVKVISALIQSYTNPDHTLSPGR
jgi:RHS repeat-associated protein